LNVNRDQSFDILYMTRPSYHVRLLKNAPGIKRGLTSGLISLMKLFIKI